MQIFLNNSHPMLPHLPGKLDFREERFFYHPPKPSVFKLIDAYDRVTAIKRAAAAKIIIKFLSDAGFLAVAVNDEVFAKKDDNEIKIKIYGSIEDIQMNVDCDIKKYDIMTLPSGHNIRAFMDFYKRYAKGILNHGGCVWNVDLWVGEVSPFIGIPGIEMMCEFKKYFGKARLASVINNVWTKDEYQEPIKCKRDGVSIKIGKIEFG